MSFKEAVKRHQGAKLLDLSQISDSGLRSPGNTVEAGFMEMGLKVLNEAKVPDVL